MNNNMIIIFFAFILGLCCGNQSKVSLIEGSENYAYYINNYKKKYHNNLLPGTINCAINKCDLKHKFKRNNCRVRHKWYPYLSKCL